MGAPGPRLLVDIGGTNCRFALADPGGAIGAVEAVPVAGFPRFEDALAAYLADRPRPAAAAIAAAGPADGDAIRLTNAPWAISRRRVGALLDGAPVRLMNDLEAVALALPHLAAADVAVVAEGRSVAGRAPKIALNAGTGLGAALVLPEAGDGWRAIATEAGHMRFAAVAPDETRIAAAAVTYEDALAGRGHRLLRTLFPDPVRRRGVYGGLLGRVAGDLVLATGAWGGVYLCGGVLGTWAENVDPDAMIERFCDKGPMAGRMAGVPVYRILLPTPALLGLAHATVA